MFMLGAFALASCSPAEENIARYCKAYHSSAKDYSLTAQLVTDGRITSDAPTYLVTSNPDGPLAKRDNETMFGSCTLWKYKADGDKLWLQLDLVNHARAVDMVRIAGRRLGQGQVAYTLSGHTQSADWHEIYSRKNCAVASNGDFLLDAPVEASLYDGFRIELTCPKAEGWQVYRWNFFDGSHRLNMIASENFTSCWMSEGTENEWVYVDLGENVKWNKAILSWISRPESASLQVSNDAKAWDKLAQLDGDMSEIKLDKIHTERYVRVFVEKASDRVALSELQIIGSRKSAAKADRPKPHIEGNKFFITGGNWKLRRADSTDESEWIPANVPGTVLTSFIDMGALPDPNYSDNQLYISDSYFNSDFIYRTTFRMPDDFDEEKVYLNFDGVSWKADVELNGHGLGSIEGAFIKGHFDVTDIIDDDEENELVVRIHRLANPGAVTEQNFELADNNGGDPGYDAPCFHASVGWDWIPTIRGRNIGIWDDVYLTTTGDVEMSDVFARPSLELPDTTKAKVCISASLKNNDDEKVKAEVKGSFGDLKFKEELVLEAGQTFDFVKVLDIENPHLWWPNGYGEPYLYDVNLSVFEDGELSDSLSFKTGIRQMTYDDTDSILNIFVNGRRFIPRGGSWGFSESNLRYTAKDYDIALAYHEDMNFNMIRNWVGQTADKEFFEACDRHGIMIWEDFWLANPVDGPEPENEAMFMANAEDFIKKLRNHPCMALYCGRNEGFPPKSLDDALDAAIEKLHSDIHYIPHSSEVVVSGYGPYKPFPQSDYFHLRGNRTNHSERGYANVMNYESLCEMLPEDKLWPINSQWGLHDFTMRGNQGCQMFIGLVDKALGAAESAKEFTEKAQWINYNGYRAIFEGRSDYRMGILLWMSHPAWPSMVWQTYDYYLDPTAAYFGCKKACAPIHIQWNPFTNETEVVNMNAGDRKGLTAKTAIYDMNGKVLFETEKTLDSSEDSTVPCAQLDYPDTDVCYIVLSLTENGKTIADNFYVKGREEGNYQALNSLGKANVEMKLSSSCEGKFKTVTCVLKNTSDTPALMLRLMAHKDGERILPVFYEDNFFSLLPGQEKTVVVKVYAADCKANPSVRLTGYNI